jgi:hypothetical protein
MGRRGGRDEPGATGAPAPNVILTSNVILSAAKEAISGHGLLRCVRDDTDDPPFADVTGVLFPQRGVEYSRMPCEHSPASRA